MAVSAATKNATVPVGWDDWAVHRMDWSPTSTMWYVDGQNVSQVSYQTPQDPSMIIFNSWSDGAPWNGNMSEGAQAYFQIRWIELVFNTTGK
ncbi:concanavalin A-like lectin/glucanase domain-containing protein [Xylariales sp. AK1849]|nr:concanavalin A-like lectin/glucanase domain-containing protein [Xylariales sp. AK1849]